MALHCCTGHQYNKQGDLTRWWTNAPLETFNDRAQCFVSQYSSYTLQGHQVEWYDVDINFCIICAVD